MKYYFMYLCIPTNSSNFNNYVNYAISNTDYIKIDLKFQKTHTKMSAIARFVMNRLVGFLIERFLRMT